MGARSMLVGVLSNPFGKLLAERFQDWQPPVIREVVEPMTCLDCGVHVGLVAVVAERGVGTAGDMDGWGESGLDGLGWMYQGTTTKNG